MTFLKQLRKQRGLTQEQVATALNVSSSAVSMWETGEREPNISVLIRLCKLLNCSIDELVLSEHELSSCIDEKDTTAMFSDFRIKAKKLLKERRLSYALLSNLIGIEESTIKGFMCGASNSRRVAENIADVLGYKLVYSNRKYELIFNDNEQLYTDITEQVTIDNQPVPAKLILQIKCRENEKSTHIRINNSAYDIIEDFSRRTGQNLTEVATAMILFAAKYTEVESKEGTN